MGKGSKSRCARAAQARQRKREARAREEAEQLEKERQALKREIEQNFDKAYQLALQPAALCRSRQEVVIATKTGEKVLVTGRKPQRVKIAPFFEPGGGEKR